MRDPVNMRSSIYNLVCSSTTVSQSISLPFFLFSHVLDGLQWKEPYGQRQNPNSFLYQRPSSWFLFYLYLYFILLSLPIIITNKSLIELIRQLILTIRRWLTSMSGIHNACPKPACSIKNLTRGSIKSWLFRIQTPARLGLRTRLLFISPL